jgi:sterol desaturase/sphingolipid hydroxylase (fatty acid hydroxylase superfamily)
MQLNYLALAVPFFTGLMYLEYYLSKKRGLGDNFHFNEAVANINVGIAERLSDLFVTGLFYFFFEWIYQNFGLFVIHPGFFTWILLFLFTDLMWYWYHRFGHEVNLFWSVHVVHHQSDDYNFTTSARITVFQAAARCIFWAFLPLLGFPPEMVAILLLIHGTYPFFTHTQLVGKLGWIEKILVTPSHHRVHHSSNPQYLDKNYGDVLIIWDKIFGTYAEEKETPVYGLTKPLNSHSFLWQHFHFILEMAVAFKRAKGIRNKLKIIFGKPDNIDPRIRAGLERKLSFKLERPSFLSALTAYIRFQTILSLFLLFLVILFEHYISGPKKLIVALFILLSVINTGSMLEQKRWIFHLELARLALIGIFVRLSFPYLKLTVFLLVLGLSVLLFYKTIGRRYYAYLYG